MNIKKPKFWDLKKPSFISYILIPFTLPFIINNFLLKFKSKTNNLEIKTICIGNIYLGGTGKTPTTIRIYEILKELGLKIVTGKKFYKSQIDENLILQKKTDLISGKDRKKIIENAKNQKKKVVVFDDGLQDRTICYDLQFVCFDSKNFIGNGRLIPSGPLREKINSLNKYDGVFLKTKKNDSTEVQKLIIKKFNPSIEIFETYFEIINIDKFDLNQNYVIFSGIGNHENFKEILKNNGFNILSEHIFEDHHNYNKKEITNILNQAKNINAKVITTEKDFVKIEKIIDYGVDFVEVKLNVKNEQKFKDFLKQKLNE